MIAAVDIEGTSVTSTGYSLQTEIIGMLAALTVLSMCAYSVMCKRQEKGGYLAIDDSIDF